MAVIIGNGGVGERLKPAVLKTVRPERVSGVRIPPPPPLHKKCSKHAAICGLLLLFAMFTLIYITVIVATTCIDQSAGRSKVQSLKLQSRLPRLDWKHIIQAG